MVIMTDCTATGDSNSTATASSYQEYRSVSTSSCFYYDLLLIPEWHSWYVWLSRILRDPSILEFIQIFITLAFWYLFYPFIYYMIRAPDGKKVKNDLILIRHNTNIK